MAADHGRIDFKWDAASHIAAIDHMRSQHKRSRLARFGVPVAMALVLLAVFHVVEGGLTFDHALQLVVLFVAFTALSTVVGMVLLSRPFRQLLLRQRSAVRCALEFDREGVAVHIGKSPIRYPWSKVRAVTEDSEYMFVVARSTCFAIPKASFVSAGDAENFGANMRRFLAP